MRTCKSVLSSVKCPPGKLLWRVFIRFFNEKMALSFIYVRFAVWVLCGIILETGDVLLWSVVLWMDRTWCGSAVGTILPRLTKSLAPNSRQHYHWSLRKTFLADHPLSQVLFFAVLLQRYLTLAAERFFARDTIFWKLVAACGGRQHCPWMPNSRNRVRIPFCVRVRRSILHILRVWWCHSLRYTSTRV